MKRGRITYGFFRGVARRAAVCGWVVTTACAGNFNGAEGKMGQVLSDTEREQGLLTPEVMWKIRRVGSPVISPDGVRVLYTVTTYDMEQNRGMTEIRTVLPEGGKSIRVSDPANNESAPQWSGDSETIYFLSDAGGNTQVWCAAPDGNNRRQVTDIQGGVEGFSR